jgi:N-acyl-phosphatidylethanolamine-hydrolysing phospholipase D
VPTMSFGAESDDGEKRTMGGMGRLAWLAGLVAGGFAFAVRRSRSNGGERAGRANRIRRGSASHHGPNGGFRNPWPTARTREEGGFLRWQRERRQRELPPNPCPDALPTMEPRIDRPRAAADDLRITWIGHATFLVQIGGLNILTDPQFSHRASPVQFAGPARFTPPPLALSDLPPIDGVVLSHDHYDHLDRTTVSRLNQRFGASLRWFTPLGYGTWFDGLGVRSVTELDWWEEAALRGPAGDLRVVALPAQHWTSRTPWARRGRLWSSWAIIAPEGTAVYFGGDSGYFPDYPEIARRVGPFDAVMLPIGAYEPRWFMRPVHMNPEEAVRAYLELGGAGTMLGMHWGTWRLTDEDPLEPPRRIREEWAAHELPSDSLRVLRHGETWIRE